MNVIDVALYVTAGAALGAVYFGLLLRAVRMHASQSAAIRVISLHGLRAAIAIAGFWIAAQYGAMPLLSVLLGFIAARFIVQRSIRLA